MKKYYVYILASNSLTLYIWVTNNFEIRLYEHKNWLLEWFTKKYNCKKLVYFEETNDILAAIGREKQLKWLTRIKKENLIKSLNPTWNDLWNYLV